MQHSGLNPASGGQILFAAGQGPRSDGQHTEVRGQVAARRGPTYLRVMLGKELQTLRQRTGETAEAVSVALGFSRSKISRVEAGDIPLPKLADLEKMLDRYGVDDPDDRSELLKMQRDSLSKEPFISYRSVLPSGVMMYVGLERDAVKIRGYENNVVHGLLQDESYAQALAGSAKIVEERTTEFVERGVRLRMERKELLSSGGTEVHIILTESTLRTVVGSADVMRAQYAEIIRLNELDNVEVQIIPEDLPTYRAAFNFTVLEFTDLAPVVQSDSAKATTMWSKESDVGQYQRQFDAMVKAAPGPSQTPQVLHALEKKLWT